MKPREPRTAACSSDLEVHAADMTVVAKRTAGGHGMRGPAACDGLEATCPGLR